MLNTAIIVAGGFGTRLQSRVHDVPKPMAPVNAEPFLNYQLRFLKHYGITKIILSVGHLANKIQDYYQSSFEGLQITYALEEKPLGTGGGIRLALQNCTEESVFVLNGDSFFDIDLPTFYGLHLQKHAQISLALRKVKDAARYGTIQKEEDDRITLFSEKSGHTKEGLINAGIYILDRKVFLNNTVADKRFSIEKDFFEKQLQHLIMKGFDFEGYFIDIGIPEDYEKAQDDFKGFNY
ncbi:MAG: nucleotidyltransferase family protein [bacterium]|nr:nucleotidyltransferase family protein [bacterium]